MAGVGPGVAPALAIARYALRRSVAPLHPDAIYRLNGRAHAPLPAQATPRKADCPVEIDAAEVEALVRRATSNRKTAGRKRDRGCHERRYLGPAGRVPVTRNVAVAL
jgi:hypothetical protein